MAIISKLIIIYISLQNLRTARPITSPAMAGHTQPNPCSENGRSTAALSVIFLIISEELIPSGSARRKSNTAATAVNDIVH